MLATLNLTQQIASIWSFLSSLADIPQQFQCLHNTKTLIFSLGKHFLSKTLLYKAV
jgi:hypothetical protein